MLDLIPFQARSNSTKWIVFCIKTEHEYIHGEGDYWVSSPNVSLSSNSCYFCIYNIYMDLPNPKILGVNNIIVTIRKCIIVNP